MARPEMHVPELRVAGRLGDGPAARGWRAERQELREEGLEQRLAVGLVTDTSGERGMGDAVRAGGADVRGLLSADPLESIAWASAVGAQYAYAAGDALRGDDIEAVVLDLPMAAATPFAELMLEEGAGVVFAQPDVPGRDAARSLVSAAALTNAPAVFALRTRAWESAAAAQRLVGELGPVSQVTVAHWPVSRSARAELCDLVRRLCGEVELVCAAVGMMPVAELAPGLPVTLAMIGEARGGAPDDVCVVVVHESPRAVLADAQLTVIGARGRLVLSRQGLTVSDAAGVREVRLERSPDPVTHAVRALAREYGGARHGAATLGDALAAARLMELAALSYERHDWADAF